MRHLPYYGIRFSVPVSGDQVTPPCLLVELLGNRKLAWLIKGSGALKYDVNHHTHACIALRGQCGE
jgi:hypothetical protein